MPTSSGAAPRHGHEKARAHFLELLASQRMKIRVTWLTAGATAALTVILALWLIPFVPIGMARDDYSPAVWVALLLAMASAIMASIAVYTSESATGQRELTNIWRGLLGRTVGLRNRHQFHRRLARECARLQRDRRSSLTLILVHVGRGGDEGGPASQDAVEYIAGALAATVRASDVMGIVGDGEVGVLAIGAGAGARARISTRFERALASALSGWAEAGPDERTPVLCLGASTFDPDDDPHSLLAAARRELKLIDSPAAKAA